MSRTLSTPLTDEDVAYLRERYSESYVARMIELHGGSLAAEEESETEPQGDGTGSSSDGADGAQTGEEDLIGSTFDPGEHTEAEIKAHLEANPDDRDRVLAAEADGKARKGVLAL